MRTTACCMLGLVGLVVACRSAPKPEAQLANRAQPRGEVVIELDDKLRDRLAFGLSMDLELRANATPVGSCKLVFDLWEETYRVWLSRADVQVHPDPIHALRSCVDPTLVPSNANILVYEIEPPKPLYERRDYPTF